MTQTTKWLSAQAMAERWAQGGDFPGVQLLVATPAGIDHGVAGVRDRTQQLPITSETAFYIGSITKPFVATLILQWMDQGGLTLDDPVSRFLPQAMLTRLANASEARLHHLLQHTSGIPEYFPYFLRTMTQYPGETWSQAELVAFAFDQPPTMTLGQGYLYGNTAYLLLGLVIEAVTRGSLGRALQDMIFDPLEMTQTCLGRAPQQTLCRGYGAFPGQTTLEDVSDWDALYEQIADGGIVSTASDMYRFTQALLFEKRLLRPETLDRMISQTVSMGENSGYGLGIVVQQAAHGFVLGHSGKVIGQQACWYAIPHRHITVVATGNRGSYPEDIFLERLVWPYLQELLQD